MNPNKMAAEIAAAGRTITLADGRTATIRYGFAGIGEIEAKHGSIGALMEALEKGEKGPIFSTLGHALWAGTQRKVPLEAFLDLLDPRRIAEYSEAFGEALSEGLGGDEQGEAEAAETPAALD